jgi:polyphosphate kinase
MDKTPASNPNPVSTRAAGRGRTATRKKIPAPSPEPDQKLAQAAGAVHAELIDVNAPELYLNRELTWLEFNRRVLHMAADEQTPLLERIKFLAIVSSNLDEFFMKRIGGLKQQIAAGLNTQTVDGHTPMEQMQLSQTMVRELHREQNQIFYNLLELLDQQSIRVVRYTGLTDREREVLREQFIANIFPLLTPLAMDPGHPFPFISNLALNLLVTLSYPGSSGSHYARVKVPMVKDIAPRFVSVGNSNTFVKLEDRGRGSG